MLSYNEITLRKYIVLDGSPYEVISSHIFRKQQRKPVNQTKLKNLVTGKVIEKSFHQSENVAEADIGTQKITYLYKKQSRQSGSWEYWFSKENDPKNRMELEESVVGDSMKYLKEKDVVNALVFNDDIMGLKVPIKVILAVVEAPPAVRGNTAQGGTKQVILETGLKVTTPLFINEGDKIVVNTETGEYVERA